MMVENLMLSKKTGFLTPNNSMYGFISPDTFRQGGFYGKIFSKRCPLGGNGDLRN